MADHTCKWAFDQFDEKHKEFSDSRNLVVCEEKGKKYTVNNKNKKLFCKYRVDDGLISDLSKEKCDYLVVQCEDKIACLIELKGNDVKKAINQIDSTIDNLQINCKTLHARIISAKVDAPQLISSTRIKLERKLKQRSNGKLVIRSSEYTEELF